MKKEKVMSKSKGKNKVLSKKEKHDSLDKIDRTMEDLMGLHREKKTIPKLAIEAKKIIKHNIQMQLEIKMEEQDNFGKDR